MQYEPEEDAPPVPHQSDVWIEEDDPVPPRDGLPVWAAVVAFGGSIYLGGNEGLTMAGVVLTLIYMLIG